MANRYANLIGANKIKDEWQKINAGFDGVQDDVDGHVEETAEDDVHGLLTDGKIIEESGSNANGEYVRFADGTLICTRTIDLDFSQISTTIPLPSTPVGNMAASMSINIGASSGTTVAERAQHYVRVSGSNWVIYFSGVVSSTISVSLMAIGRWKA